MIQPVLSFPATSPKQLRYLLLLLVCFFTFEGAGQKWLMGPVAGCQSPLVVVDVVEQTASGSRPSSPQFIISFSLLGPQSLALGAFQFLDLGQSDGRLEIQTGQFSFLDLVRQVSAMFFVAVVLDVATPAGVRKSVGISHGFGSFGEIISARNHQTRSAQRALIPPQTDKWVHLSVQDAPDRYWCVEPRHDRAAEGFHRRNRRLRSS